MSYTPTGVLLPRKPARNRVSVRFPVRMQRESVKFAGEIWRMIGALLRWLMPPTAIRLLPQDQTLCEPSVWSSLLFTGVYFKAWAKEHSPLRVQRAQRNPGKEEFNLPTPVFPRVLRVLCGETIFSQSLKCSRAHPGICRIEPMFVYLNESVV